MNTVLQTSNTMPRETMTSLPLRNEAKERRRHHHERSKSLSDAIVVDASLLPVGSSHYLSSPNNGTGTFNNRRYMYSHNHSHSHSIPNTNGMAGIHSHQTGAAVPPFQIPPHAVSASASVSMPAKSSSNKNITNNNTARLYYHGRKPSLAGFDPFASADETLTSRPSTSNQKNHSRRHSVDVSGAAAVAAAWESGPSTPTTATRNAAVVATSRDSSPSGGEAKHGSSKQQRQPPPPSPSHREKFDNESSKPNNNNNNTVKGSIKKVNKFLRKSGLVKTLSLARQIATESSNSSPSKSKSNHDIGKKIQAAVSPVSVLAVNDPATATATQTPTPKHSSGVRHDRPGRVSLSFSATSKGPSVSVVGDQQLSPSTPSPSTSTASPLPSTTPPPFPESSGTTTMAQDLMELQDSFRNYSLAINTANTSANASPNASSLHLPSLAKPRHNYAPTSFLTGQQNDCCYHHDASYSCIPNEPTPFQLEIPSLNEVVTVARLNEFVDNYRRQDQNLDLSRFVGLSKKQLQEMVYHSNLLNNTSVASHNASGSSNSGNNIGNSNSGSGLLVQEHVPIIQSLLDCSEHDRETTLRTTAQEGGEISIQGFLTEPGDHSADDRTEAVIFQGERNFTVVFRGTTEQQARGLVGGGNGSSSSSKSKKRAVPLDDDNNNDNYNDHRATAGQDSPETKTGNNDRNSCVVEVYSGFKDSYSRVEEECFRQLDKLVDENPFCDVTFSGYSYGAALATLAAYRYAIASPMVRVGCLTLASPKVGFSQFRQAVNNMPNLRVMRLELGRDANCQGPTVGGSHVGHTLVLNSAVAVAAAAAASSGTGTGSGQGKPSVSVYKFETPKPKNAFFKTSHPGLTKYISTLEDLSTLNKNSGKSASSLMTWATDFANNAGEGVVVNNEKRLMV